MAKSPNTQSANQPTTAKLKSKQPRPAARPGTKQALLIDLLKRKKGATIEKAVKVIEWQPHSVRGAISGTLKKKLGMTVTSDKVKRRGRVYQIVACG